MNKLVKVTIKWVPDDNPDLGYLETTPEEHYGENGSNWAHVSNEDKQKVIEQYGSIWNACVAYARQDRERLESYGRSWYMQGCYAVAEIHILTQQGGHSTIQHIRSGGLWGIESDSDGDYKQEIEQEQLADLKSQLDQLNVDTSNFQALVPIA